MKDLVEMPLRKRRRRLKFVGEDIVDDIRAKYGFEGDLSHFYARGTERLIDKWHHYIPLYDRYFSHFRGTRVRFLEIGVSQGGSLDLWRSYFGEKATIFGIDIDADCARFDGISGSVRIGSQSDPEFLDDVVSEMSGIDVVLDDGSHRMDHIRETLTHLFPKLARGGTYLIEDLQAAYFAEFGGGIDSDGNFFDELRRYADALHRHYHDAEVVPDFAREISGVHMHDSIVVLDKGPVHPPCRSRVVRTGA